MPYQPSVNVTADLTAHVAAQFAVAAADLRHETAARILAASVANAAEETGGLKASHYIVDERGSGYSAAAAAALAKNPKAEILPGLPAEPDTSIIAVAVAYGEPAELYTGEKNPGAHPYLGPAAEGERPAFEAGVARLGGRVG